MRKNTGYTGVYGKMSPRRTGNAVLLPNWKLCTGILPGKSGCLGGQRWKKSIVANNVFASSKAGSRRNEAQKLLVELRKGLVQHPQRFRIIPC